VNLISCASSACFAASFTFAVCSQCVQIRHSWLIQHGSEPVSTTVAYYYAVGTPVIGVVCRVASKNANQISSAPYQHFSNSAVQGSTDSCRCCSCAGFEGGRGALAHATFQSCGWSSELCLLFRRLCPFLCRFYRGFIGLRVVQACPFELVCRGRVCSCASEKRLAHPRTSLS